MSDVSANFKSLLYQPDEGTIKKLHVLEVPYFNTQSSRRSYNIAMVDVSASMHEVWPYVLQYWNEYISPSLIGDTDIYTFGTAVTHRRRGTALLNSDNDQTSTNLTDALATIREQVESCTDPHMRIFIITDGHHNATNTSPDEEIMMMRVPDGKTIEVFLLGVGTGFPVEYSVNIRSYLHNGSSTCPTIFWAKYPEDIEDQMKSISEEMRKGMVKMQLSMPAKTIPLIDETVSVCYAGEYILYEEELEDIMRNLVITTEDGTKIQINPDVQEASLKFMVNELFRQWNAILLQRFKNKKTVPMDVFEIMKKAFSYKNSQKKESNYDNSVRGRLMRKDEKKIETDFRTLMNDGSKLIAIESAFSDELEMAQALLNTAVSTKYSTKVLSLRGQTEKEWDIAVENFKKLYMSKRESILSLPEPTVDDSCRVLMCSFIGDLKDPNFLEIFDQSKADYLANITITGIPAFAPVKDSVIINCWTLALKSICCSPFDILSQRAMESSLALEGTDTFSPDKEVTLQKDNPNSKFNIIVPIIPKEACQVLKPFVRSDVFAAGASFCILKDPLIIDHNCHFAALACIWMKTIYDFPKSTRPGYICNRIINVEETAKLYLDRRGILMYTNALLDKPELALMTENPNDYNGITLRSESIIKPAFILHLVKAKILQTPTAKSQFKKLLQMILIEFLGRCLTSNTCPTPYMTFLVSKEVHENRAQWLDQLSEEFLEKLNLSGEVLFRECYAPMDVEKFVDEKVKTTLKVLLEEQTSSNGGSIFYNKDKLLHLRNSGSAGNVTWEVLRAWAEEMTSSLDSQQLMSEAELEEVFSNDMVCMYINHALMNRKSSERFVRPMMSVDDALKYIADKLAAEKKYYLSQNLVPKVMEQARLKWQNEYDKCHRDLALPLSKEQIVSMATERGVQVTLDTFSKVYKYRESVGLCRNCCHVKACPFFLTPNRRFNCHIEVERKDKPYLFHKLHVIVSVPANRTEVTKCINEVKHSMREATGDEHVEESLKKYVQDLFEDYEGLQV